MKILAFAEKVLSFIAAILPLLIGCLPHFNFRLHQRLLREASRLKEIDAAAHSFRSVSDANQETAVDNVAIPLGEMAYSVARNQASEKICWLLFVSETNKLRACRENWGLRVAPPYVALFAAFFALFPISTFVEATKKPNQFDLVLTAFILWVIWIVLLECFSAVLWRALRQDVFIRNLRPFFTGIDLVASGEIKKVFESTVTDFQRTIGGTAVAASGLVAWICAILSWIAWFILSLDYTWGMTVMWFNVSARTINQVLFIIMAVCVIVHGFGLWRSKLMRGRSV